MADIPSFFFVKGKKRNRFIANRMKSRIENYFKNEILKRELKYFTFT